MRARAEKSVRPAETHGKLGTRQVFLWSPLGGAPLQKNTSDCSKAPNMHCRQFRGRQKSVQYACNPCMPGILFIPVSHNGSGWQKAPAAEVPGKLNTKDRHYTTARMAAGERKAIDLSEDGGRRAIDLSGPGDQDFRTKHATCAYCKRRVQVLEEFCCAKYASYPYYPTLRSTPPPHSTSTGPQIGNIRHTAKMSNMFTAHPQGRRLHRMRILRRMEPQELSGYRKRMPLRSDTKMPRDSSRSSSLNGTQQLWNKRI